MQVIAIALAGRDNRVTFHRSQRSYKKKGSTNLHACPPPSLKKLSVQEGQCMYEFVVPFVTSVLTEAGKVNSPKQARPPRSLPASCAISVNIGYAARCNLHFL